MVVATYLFASGIARYLIEFARVNTATPLGLT